MKFLRVFSAALLLGLGTQAVAQESTVTLRLASTFPPPNVAYNSYTAQAWIDEVTKRTNGRVKFQVFWGGALGKPAEHVNLVKTGAVDVVLTNAQFTPGLFPIAQFEYAFPFGPSDPEIVTKAKRKIHEEFPQFAADFDKQNAVQIFNAPGTIYQILTKQPVVTLDDYKGKKFNLVGRYFGQWIAAVGGVPVVGPAHEVYTLLQSGVINGAVLPVEMFNSFKIQEQAKHLSVVDGLVGNYLDLLINKDSFNKLDAETQKILLEAGRDVELSLAQTTVQEKEKEVYEILKKQGVTFHQLSAEDRARWIEQTPDLPADWAREVTAQGYPGFDIVRRYQEITTELGHEWPRKWGQQ